MCFLCSCSVALPCGIIPISTLGLKMLPSTTLLNSIDNKSSTQVCISSFLFSYLYVLSDNLIYTDNTFWSLLHTPILYDLLPSPPYKVLTLLIGFILFNNRQSLTGTNHTGLSVVPFTGARETPLFSVATALTTSLLLPQ